MKIPQQVIEAAQYEGCNSVKYLGKNGTLDVFGISEVDDNGRPVPVGLPTLVLWDGETVEFVCGEDALHYPIGDNGIEIPQQVKEAAEGMGTVITYVHHLKVTKTATDPLRVCRWLSCSRTGRLRPLSGLRRSSG